ncbi:MAG TPA: hypothetical protein VNR42_04665 [Solirubrobacteraceae bacterium]|nr:hypothetical protein [Solirubrobacteraceae bacterium]
MTPPVVGTGTLRRLRELDSSGQPVLSVYLDTDSTRYPTASARADQLQELMAGVGWEVGEINAERVRQSVLSLEGLAYGAHSLALFSSFDGAFLEIVPLPSHVDATAVLDTLPWLEPLTSLLSCDAHRRRVAP